MNKSPIDVIAEAIAKARTMRALSSEEMRQYIAVEIASRLWAYENFNSDEFFKACKVSID